MELAPERAALPVDKAWPCSAFILLPSEGGLAVRQADPGNTWADARGILRPEKLLLSPLPHCMGEHETPGSKKTGLCPHVCVFLLNFDLDAGHL